MGTIDYCARVGSRSSAPPSLLQFPDLTWTGAEILYRVLQEENVECIFGYLGASTLPIMDIFYKHDKNELYDFERIKAMGKVKNHKPSADFTETTDNTSSPLLEPGKAWKGAEILHQALLDEKVQHIFGYIGGAVLPIFDVLYKSPIHFIVTRHEQGGAHAADAYARATGKVGVVLATSGPGATNLVTGLANAYMDSVPVVAITGQVRCDLIGNDAFQEADMTGITRPITKHNILVRDIRDLAHIVREAFHIARTGRPGPVLIDIPVDISSGSLTGPIDLNMNIPGYRPRFKGHLRQIQLAAEAINKAQQPVLYVGGGVIISEATELLRKLATKANIPVTTTLMGMGAIDEKHPLALKMLGMHGTPYANFAVQESDLLIAVGARFDDRVTGKLATFAPKAQIIHIDIDPASISKNVQVDIPVVGDAKQILADLINLVEAKDRSAWLNKINEWKTKYPLQYDTKCGTIKPQYVIETLGKLASNAIVTTGVGQHQMWAAQFFSYKEPRQLITSGGLGTMGFGLPAAIGAQIGQPDKTVIDIDGDGSFSMTLTELGTIAQYKLPIKIALIRNSFLGMVRQWQELFYGRRYSCTEMSDPDFIKIAEGFGIKAVCVKDKNDVEKVIAEALKYPGPVLMDFEVEKEENVWPMVAPTKGLHEMSLGRLA